MYTDIDCVPVGKQDGEQRFEVADAPLMKIWRCNLTGLSHSHNLYFVACNSEIHIYSPVFPEQTLHTPELILHPPATPGHHPQGIDPHDPHSINRLHVDYLGAEEILLVACDDGDVIGYRIREIAAAIAENQRFSQRGNGVFVEQRIRVFLHRNVGESAWGLAVHRKARLIAISANSHMITVLAFALSNPITDSGAEAYADLESLDRSGFAADFPQPRRRDHVITLTGTSNIPSVHFNQHDEGRWLFSSEINGDNLLWDLHNPEGFAKEIWLGRCVTSLSHDGEMRCRCDDSSSVPHASWAAMFINPLSCKATNSLAEACGPGYTRIEIPLPCEHGGIFDITETKARFKARTDWSLIADRDQSGPSTQPVPSQRASVEPGPATSASTNDKSESTADPATTDSDSDIFEDDSDLDLNPAQSSLETTLPGQPVSNDLEQPVLNDSEVVSEWHSEWHSESDVMKQRLEKKPFSVMFTPGTLDSSLTLCPCIIVTKEEIFLVQRLFKKDGDKPDPILMMQNPLFPPTFPPSETPETLYNRQSFTAQIPELGLLIVGSPCNRVGIFALTSYTRGQPDPHTMYAFRLAHILPFRIVNGEEVVDDGIHEILVGIAVGPVQGMLDGEGGWGKSSDGGDEDVGDGAADAPEARIGTRRWRIILHYHEHSIRSFEVGKFSGPGEMRLAELPV